jgi:hypothetical protein
MEVLDPLRGQSESRYVEWFHAVPRGLHILFGNLKRLARRRRPAVEAPAQVAQRGVTFVADAGADLSHRGALGVERGEVEAAPGT